jgi:magnesium chelatase accessory protein
VSQTDGDAWPKHSASSFVDAAGLKWHVQRSGSGPNILLLHGFAASTHSWREIIPILARDYSVLAIDLPGHGRTSAIPSVQSSISGLGNMLTILLDTLDFNPAFVVGHSAGAVILCSMALSHQISPRAIVSVNGAFVPLFGVGSSFLSRFGKRFSSRPFLHRNLARRAFDHRNVARLLESTGSHLDETGIDLYAKLLQDPEHVMGALSLMGNWDLESFVAQLALLTQPLELLVGGNDKAVPLKDVFEIMQHVKTATLHPMPRLGHLAHEEQPALVGERIIQIISAYGEQSAPKRNAI